SASQPLPLVYAGFDANGTCRLFVTKDGGDSWSELPSPPSDGQLGFNNVITVGPYNSDEVYIGQIAFWRSFDGGTKGGRNDYHVSPPVESNFWAVLGCCLSGVQRGGRSGGTGDARYHHLCWHRPRRLPRACGCARLRSVGCCIGSHTADSGR